MHWVAALSYVKVKRTSIEAYKLLLIHEQAACR